MLSSDAPNPAATAAEAELVSFILSQSALELEGIMRQPQGTRHYSLDVKYHRMPRELTMA